MFSGSATSQQSVQAARDELAKFLRKLETRPMYILEVEGERILEEARLEAPYRTGKLEDAIYVRISKNKRRPGLVAGASAKSNGYDYAGIQHERSDFEHPVKGKDHFISDPFRRGTKRIMKRFDQEIKL